jgi:hypothetical protein
MTETSSDIVYVFAVEELQTDGTAEQGHLDTRKSYRWFRKFSDEDDVLSHENGREHLSDLAVNVAANYPPIIEGQDGSATPLTFSWQVPSCQQGRENQLRVPTRAISLTFYERTEFLSAYNDANQRASVTAMPRIYGKPLPTPR